MWVDDIKDPDVKFATMMIGYKVYQSNRLNLVFGTTIHIAY